MVTKFRLKRCWNGSFRLQVLEENYVVTGNGHYDDYNVKRWRNATLEEATQVGIPLA